MGLKRNRCLDQRVIRFWCSSINQNFWCSTNPTFSCRCGQHMPRQILSGTIFRNSATRFDLVIFSISLEYHGGSQRDSINLICKKLTVVFMKLLEERWGQMEIECERR